jgi:hypothetical protein
MQPTSALQAGTLVNSGPGIRRDELHPPRLHGFYCTLTP